MESHFSSSPLDPSTRESSPDFGLIKKPKKKSTVTPRSFQRFFTPRTSSDREKRLVAGRHALADITYTAANRTRRRCSSVNVSTKIFDEDENPCLGSNGLKERKGFLCTPETTPERSSPLKRPRSLSREHSEAELFHRVVHSEIDELVGELNHQALQVPNRIAMSKTRGILGTMLRRETNILSGPSQGFMSKHHPDWLSEVADFYSAPEDVHFCKNVVTEHPESVIPFCSTACNTNSLIAIGDEEGGVRLLESGVGSKPNFEKPFLVFRPHNNAVLDMTFSSDDLLMATASGDQTAQIIDMPTQRTCHVLCGHVSSLKQVRFQPRSNNKVIVTSSRDGSIQVWDLRCKGTEHPISNIKVNLGGTVSSSATSINSDSRMTYASCVNMIQEAHVCTASSVLESLNATSVSTGLQPRRTAVVQQRSGVSITTLAFLCDSNPHLLLSGSEAHATVRLWDLRMNYSHRQKKAVPLSTTSQPDSHGSHRQFGLTSMVVSGDDARLFTLCKDNTVYAYSTAHLILGASPELEPNSVTKPRRGLVEKEGLGPIYGFRHPKLKVSTFYVKLALRPAKRNKNEMLAIGSTDSCAVLFPTNEQYFGHPRVENPSLACGPEVRATVPIYDNGLALVRGHDREVTGTAWNCEGELITVGDDMRCRVWREDAQKSKELRLAGEINGDRWCHGWAEIEPENDEWDQDE